MAKKSKSASSPWVLIVPLVIAIIVVISAAILSQKAAYTRSKASFNPTQECVKFCNTKYGGDQSLTSGSPIKDAAACALDCPAVVATQSAMTCNEFCQENVKPVSHQTTSCGSADKIKKCQANCGTTNWQCKQDCENKFECPIVSSIGTCKTQCQSWKGDPCDAQGAVCKEAIGAKRGEAKTQCAAACELVKEEEKTCDEAMTASSLSSVNETYRKKVLTNCKNYFE